MGKTKPRTLGWIDLPESKSGKSRIEHRLIKKDERVTMRSRRESFFGDGKSTYTIAPYDIRLHYLVEDGEATWASDHPQEVFSQMPCVEGFHGSVLVGGLGVGLIIAKLLQMPEVTSITVIEKSEDVIKLVWDKVVRGRDKRRCSVVCHDLFDFLTRCQWKGVTYDCAYYDIWCPNGEDVLFTHIRPLRSLSRGVVTDKLTCWQEDVMTGQLTFELRTCLATLGQVPGYAGLSDGEFDRAYNSSRTRWAFWNWYRKTKPNAETAQAMAELYSKNYACSTEAWLKVFGEFERKETT